MLKISITSTEGSQDVTSLVPSVTWSGEYTQCARTLEFGLLSSSTDFSIPDVNCELGAAVSFEAEGAVLFDGYIFSRQKSTSGNTIDITCYDRGLYLKRNKAVYKFAGTTAEDITRTLCNDFDIEVGSLADTGIKISRSFTNVPLYRIIQTAYTLAAEQSGEKYHIRFDGGKLSVLGKDVNDETVVIRGGSNLMSASTTERIDKMVNRIVIYDGEDNQIAQKDNAALIQSYGLFQDYIRQSPDNDALKRAEKLLADNGVSQKITIENLGDIRCITGNTIVVQEPYTGQYGLFWIDSDVHTWKKGLYLNKLVINFNRIMDEQEAGSLPNAGKGSIETSKDMWEYIYKK